MNLQLIANEEYQDRAQCGENETSGMISFVCRARKHVGNAAADDRSDDAEHDRPEDRYVHVHHRFSDDPAAMSSLLFSAYTGLMRRMKRDGFAFRIPKIS